MEPRRVEWLMTTSCGWWWLSGREAPMQPVVSGEYSVRPGLPGRTHRWRTHTIAAVKSRGCIHCASVKIGTTGEASKEHLVSGLPASQVSSWIQPSMLGKLFSLSLFSSHSGTSCLPTLSHAKVQNKKSNKNKKTLKYKSSPLPL